MQRACVWGGMVHLTLALVLTGCAAPGRSNSSDRCRRYVELIPASPNDRTLILKEIAATPADALITIQIDPESDELVMDLRSESSGVVSDQVVQREGSDIQRFTLYRVACPAAVNIFRQLYDLVAGSYVYRSPGHKSSSEPSGVYLLTAGRKPGLTINEGGPLEIPVSQALRWAAARDEGEDVEDGDLATSCFDPSMGSIAGWTSFAVELFDELCLTASEANADAPGTPEMTQAP